MKAARIWMATASAAVWALAATSAVPARAEINIYFRAGLPPPSYAAPVVVVDRHGPDYVVIPGTRTTYVRGVDHDVYRYRDTFWAYDNGYWYSGRNLNGPWVAVRAERVPAAVLFVPAPYHTRWAPVPVQYRVKSGVIRHEIREERREDRRERKVVKHHYKKDHDHD